MQKYLCFLKYTWHAEKVSMFLKVHVACRRSICVLRYTWHTEEVSVFLLVLSSCGVILTQKVGIQVKPISECSLSPAGTSISSSLRMYILHKLSLHYGGQQLMFVLQVCALYQTNCKVFRPNIRHEGSDVLQFPPHHI